MVDLNRLLWMVLFLLGTAVFGWLEWQGDGNSKMAFFLLTSIWSAVCGIGYSVMYWFITKRTKSKEVS